MIINSNNPFFHDSITDGWTKKEWALNLIPLGGVASVAYEIGSACLSSRERNAKISEDFFKSPIQTTLEKIAQCLWVPIVACGALKLVCFIIKACWNRCFPPVNSRLREESQVIDPPAENSCASISIEESQVIDPPAENSCASISIEESQVIDPTANDPFAIIPPEVVFNHILSCLNLHELGVSRSVSKIWNQCASTPTLWQSAVYREIAFSSNNWAEWNAALVNDVDIRQEMLSLPQNIAEELRRSAFPGKSIRETHILVRMPKGLTVKKLGELAKKYFPSNINGYKDIRDRIIDELGDKSVEESFWLLMTKEVLPGSRNKSYEQQKTTVAELAATTGAPYQVPTALEAATCILAEYSRSKNRLFNDSPWTFTHCKESVQGWQVVVGSFAPAGLVVNCYYAGDDIGVAALRKF